MLINILEFCFVEQLLGNSWSLPNPYYKFCVGLFFWGGEEEQNSI